MQKSKANVNTSRTGDGFSVIELLITATILTIVTAVGIMGITRARATVRLSGSAREYASYIQKARLFSIRRHADDASERASVSINEDLTSYDVTMDLDGDGDMDTRTITLPDGVRFEKAETIAFDWRGRTWSTVDGVTIAYAQVSIRLVNDTDLVSIDVTGSGDITIDSGHFDDAVPNVNLKVGDLSSGATPVPTPAGPAAAATPDPTANPDTGGGTVDTGGGTVDTGGSTGDTGGSTGDTGGSTGADTGGGTTPNPDSPSSPSVCTLKTDVASLTISADGTETIKVSHDANAELSITASSSKPSDLQVTPGGSQSVAPGGAASFTVKSKRSLGGYSITFSTSCGSKTVSVIVASLL